VSTAPPLTQMFADLAVSRADHPGLVGAQRTVTYAQLDENGNRVANALLDLGVEEHGRVEDMIVTGAENVYPVEVESELSEHPDVADVAVIGVPDERWGETVKAIVVRRPGSPLTEEELLSWSRGRIAGFKRPRSVDFVEELPRNPTGKLLKRVLREPYWAGTDRNIG
jgi:acyl-CoA synthetase (AMP-forming)/AMP-acid ligase II